ncbi:UPF0481 protein At3g47200-like [Cornus florida]|uniref:UPF0481 protein At3g47200-like n=1 Tax=Cornus florida TaxID=4283 RepID=UPI0028965564|nr:UPF0481 protein At3g47200-like [Cornus florida]
MNHQFLQLVLTTKKNLKLQGMEEFKLQYLKSLLLRKEEKSAEGYVTAMRELEEKARKCYAEPTGLASDEFVHMMLLDGCFIIELFLKSLGMVRRDDNDPIFGIGWMGNCLRLDLILFENHLPFFVLLKLYDLIEGPDPEMFILIALLFFETFLGHLGEPRFDTISSLHEAQHLLGFLHGSRCPRLETGRNREIRRSEWRSIQCASQLQKGGIKFKKAEGRNMFDITYSNGTIRIPHLTIADRTESLFRNLIAHEQYGDDFSVLLYHQLLHLHGFITFDMSYFNYGNIFNNVSMHCWKRRHRWMAKLRRDYFNSPWALISFLAAFVLLLLTIIQTVCAAWSYIPLSFLGYNPNYV